MKRKRKLANQQLAFALKGSQVSNKEIASALGVGVRTVETHREHIMRKLNIHSVAGLTKFAISKGLIQLNGTCSVQSLDEPVAAATSRTSR